MKKIFGVLLVIASSNAFGMTIEDFTTCREYNSNQVQQAVNVISEAKILDYAVISRLESSLKKINSCDQAAEAVMHLGALIKIEKGI